MRYFDVASALFAFGSLGSQKRRIIEFLFSGSVFHGGYTDLTFALGLKASNVSNVRKAIIELADAGLVYIDRGVRALYDDDGALVKSAPMVACFLVDNWIDKLSMMR